ncbi:unnamed protein product [Cuscuta epithymum]|uniref:Uncharacterized protein n=1 Tax=Cuscuta epithymum TaxID=186058 RepID=A0AAV0G3J5_9ASTE|nr:unnamed protein product [Cuscuta epithymum]CAH9142524.1 unnamed protein product [Cuscuta epithymum]
MWLVFRNTLATLDNLEYLESWKYLFSLFALLALILQVFGRTFVNGRAFEDMNTLSSSIKWIRKEHRGVQIRNKSICIAFCCAIYTIRRSRNSAYFDHLLFQP